MNLFLFTDVFILAQTKLAFYTATTSAMKLCTASTPLSVTSVALLITNAETATVLNERLFATEMLAMGALKTMSGKPETVSNASEMEALVAYLSSFSGTTCKIVMMVPTCVTT